MMRINEGSMQILSNSYFLFIKVRYAGRIQHF